MCLLVCLLDYVNTCTMCQRYLTRLIKCFSINTAFPQCFKEFKQNFPCVPDKFSHAVNTNGFVSIILLWHYRSAALDESSETTVCTQLTITVYRVPREVVILNIVTNVMFTNYAKYTATEFWVNTFQVNFLSTKFLMPLKHDASFLSQYFTKYGLKIKYLKFSIGH